MRQWAVNEVEDLPTYAHGRVVLIGDAVRKLEQRYLTDLIWCH